MTRPLLPMKFNVRADLFGQLAAMEEAGLPFDRVLEIVHLPPSEAARLKATRKWIRLGLGIAEAGGRSGFFLPPGGVLGRAGGFACGPARTQFLFGDQG